MMTPTNKMTDEHRDYVRMIAEQVARQIAAPLIRDAIELHKAKCEVGHEFNNWKQRMLGIIAFVSFGGVLAGSGLIALFKWAHTILAG